MGVPYELTGRTRQKGRTREAMLRAARELLGEGSTPTVERAADRAGISRTTAYRYFPNQRALLVATYPEIDRHSLLDAAAPLQPEARLARVVDQLIAQTLDHEPELRAALRLSLEVPTRAPEALPLRRGRAIGWIADALAPLRGTLPGPALRRLVLAIRAGAGIEAFVWLRDVGRLSREDAAEVMKWSAAALLRAALAESRTTASRKGTPAAPLAPTAGSRRPRASRPRGRAVDG